MKEQRGDLWELPADVRCITTNGFVKSNGRAVMGRGCAQEARDRYPGVDAYLGLLLTEKGNHVHELMVAAYEPVPAGGGVATAGHWEMVSFPVKHNWWEIADLDLIRQSCEELVQLADLYPHWQRILLPRPGCGNGQLSWDRQVRPLVAELLDDRVVVIDR